QLVAQALRVPAAAHEAYFRQELAHIDEPTAPFNVLDARQSGAVSETVELPLDASLGRDIRAEARRRGVSPAVLFHVAWAQVLARCTGRNEVVFGTVLSGRMHGAGGADRAWGIFINTLPIRVVVEGTAADAVEQTRRRLAELLEYEHAPLSLAQRCSSVPSSLPLFTALLNYRHSDDIFAMSGGMRLLAAEETTNYPISMSVDDFGDRFALTAQVVDGLDAARLAGYFAHTIESLAAELRSDGTRSLRALDVLPPPERERVLSEFNATTVDYPRESLIHELFEQQAAESPDAVAVVDEHRVLTYAELNARANRIAHYLIAQGVRPDERVALCCERSAELIIGLLGILKAGGAYVPLDAEYPPERLAFMLEDSAPKRLLLQSAMRERLPTSAVPQLVLDDSEAELAA
ncbi:AMP-binding protein, partial [Lysobacter sp. Root604]|uniref:AMP-binding protein n=1 Tax=Lysobacter sp. Root604 TaxID=1736568 RepID=UPI00138F24AD